MDACECTSQKISLPSEIKHLYSQSVDDSRRSTSGSVSVVSGTAVLAADPLSIVSCKIIPPLIVPAPTCTIKLGDLKVSNLFCLFICLCGLVGYILLVGEPMPPGNAFAMWRVILYNKAFSGFVSKMTPTQTIPVMICLPVIA